MDKMTLDINPNAFKKQLEEKLQAELKAKLSYAVDFRLNAYFANKEETATILRNKQKFDQVAATYSSIPDADIGFIDRFISEKISEYFETKLNGKLNNIVEANIDRCLEEAVEKALSHQARKLCFSEENIKKYQYELNKLSMKKISKNTNLG